MRQDPLPYNLPTLGDEEKQELINVLESGCLTTGPMTRQFEEMMCSHLDVRNTIGVCSCTAALHLCLAALGIGEGDEVITTPLTFCSTVNVILHQKATPILADISSDTWNLDPEKVEAAITPSTRAIIPVHFAGHPCEMDRLLDIAEGRGLVVVEDAAHALGALYKGAQIGKLSDATCFSFCIMKSLTTGEGGMITTDNDDLEDRIRMLSHHGIVKDVVVRYSSEAQWSYQVMAPGFKYNMTDLEAAIGVHQLSKLDQFLDRRSSIAQQYREAIANIEGIDLPDVKSYVRHSWQLFPVLVNLDMLTIDRARFIEELLTRNIEASVNYIPIHFHQYFRDLFGDQDGRYPIAEWIYHREITLPIYPRMTDQDVADVIEAVDDVSKKFRR
jgi:dTDP-4-amino-4,6-dideoxygalactose transaminase